MPTLGSGIFDLANKCDWHSLNSLVQAACCAPGPVADQHLIASLTDMEKLVFDLASLVPTLVGGLGLLALGSSPNGPCGGAATSPAVTITDHCRAICNHARSLVVLIVRRSGAAG
ncbi:hypothetical protein GCM10010233_21360 [Streptomyces pseudogriseolus]|nr:hypothetical protein GCM10010233_21360 [Streptomyces gancidicus]GHF12421.1 hypothetical protein GCM10018789_48400 [Streptomyces werraensis]